MMLRLDALLIVYLQQQHGVAGDTVTAGAQLAPPPGEGSIEVHC